MTRYYKMQLTIVLHDSPTMQTPSEQAVLRTGKPNMDKIREHYASRETPLHDVLATKQGLYRQEIAPVDNLTTTNADEREKLAEILATKQDAPVAQTNATGPSALHRVLPALLAIEMSAINVARPVADDKLEETLGYLFFASDRRSYLQKGDSEAEKIAATMKMVEEWREMDPVLRKIFESDAEKIRVAYQGAVTKTNTPRPDRRDPRNRSEDDRKQKAAEWREHTDLLSAAVHKRRAEEKQRAFTLFSQHQRDAGQTDDQKIAAEWDDMAPREKKAWYLAANPVESSKDRKATITKGRAFRLEEEAKELKREFDLFAQTRRDILSANTHLSEVDITRRIEHEWETARIERDAYLIFMIRSRNVAMRGVCDLTNQEMFAKFSAEWKTIDKREKDELLRLAETSKHPGKPIPMFMRFCEVPNRSSFVRIVERPLSPYLYFCSERRPELKQEDPTMPFGDLTKQIAAEWKSLSIPERKKWIDLSNQDKARYERELTQ